jgi:hypothetical protein
MAKPILVIYLKNAHMERMNQARESFYNHSMANEYHILVFSSDRDNVRVFYEKDQVELDKKKLEELLALANGTRL